MLVRNRNFSIRNDPWYRGESVYMGDMPTYFHDEDSVVAECARQNIDLKGYGADKMVVVDRLIKNHLERRSISPAPAPETPPPLTEIVVTSSSASDISSDGSNGSIN